MDDNRMVSNWYTDFCPCCENALMVCDGETESCPLCLYERKWIDAPLDDDADAWLGAGLA